MYNGAIQTLPLTFLTQLATTDLMPHGRQIEHYYYVHQAGQLYNSKLYRPKVQADGSFLRVWRRPETDGLEFQPYSSPIPQ